MTYLKACLDDGPKGVWSNIRMDNDDPCWIGVAETGVLVKKSKVGLFGPKLYDRDAAVSANAAMGLLRRFPNILTPPNIQHPLLLSFSNAALHCSSIYELKNVLNDDFIINQDHSIEAHNYRSEMARVITH